MALGFVNFVAGNVLTEDQIDGIMRQTVMSFANATARDSALSGVLDEGMVAFLEDTDTVTVYNGSAWVEFGTAAAWTSHTPTLAQGASTNITKTVDYSKYVRHGRTITWSFALSATAAGTAASAVTVTLPVTAADVLALHGIGQVYDLSTTTRYVCEIGGNSTTTVVFVAAGTGAGWGADPNLAVASGDTFRGTITYEAAS